MKNSKVLLSRIRRVKVLFKEIGYQLFDEEKEKENYACGFDNQKGNQGFFFIDTESRFLEIAFTFSFSSGMEDFLKSKLEEIMEICYEFGCYLNIQKDVPEDIAISLFSKIYYSGLNYIALSQTLSDFNACIDSVKETIDIKNL